MVSEVRTHYPNPTSYHGTWDIFPAAGLAGSPGSPGPGSEADRSTPQPK